MPRARLALHTLLAIGALSGGARPAPAQPAEARAADKAQAKPAEAKPAKSDAKPAPKAEAKSEAKAEAKATPKSEPKPEAKAKPAKNDAKPEPKAEPKPEPKPEAKPEPKKPEAKPEPKSEAKPAKSASKPETKSTKAESKPAPKPEAKPATKAEANKKPEPEAPRKTSAGDVKKADDAPQKTSASTPADSTGAKSSSGKVGPQRGAGSRSVEVPGSLPEFFPEAPAKSSAPAPKTSHKKGGPPKKPAPTLPPGAPRSEPDAATRRLIAEGPTDEDLRAGKDDPELRSLREAERVLFPEPLPGVQPGWSWLPTPVPSGGPEIVASGRPPGPVGKEPPADAPADAAWLKSLTLPNLPVRFDEHVVKYLRFYRDSPSGRSIARVWAKKSGRYLAAIRAELAKAGLPTDLVWLSLIESGHNPTITSPAGAAGLWQFMPDSGRTYGLTVDRWVDERLDPERSTVAAARYLSDLYRRFGNWDLAMAAYNMGHGGLSRAIRKFNTNSFWELARYEAGIPWETTLYVPKILATAIVMTNKRAFGLDGITPDPPDSFDVVLVGPGLPLAEVASAAGVSLAEIEALNPQYLAGRTPPQQPGAGKVSWRVRVPAGKAAVATRVLAQNTVYEALESHTVRFGETVESIANARATTEARIRALNRVEPKEVLAPGTVLLVPKRPEPVPEAPGGGEVVVVPPREFRYPDKQRVFYRVVAGDTVASVGRAFQVGPEQIVTWNALDETARLHSGMVLQLFVDKDRDLSGLRYATEKQVRVLIAGSPEFCDYYEGLNGKRRIVVAAREGDTLASVGRRYGTSVGWMERINRRSRNDKLKPGETLIVYTDRAPAGPQKSESKTLVSALSPIDAPFPAALPGLDDDQGGADGRGSRSAPSSVAAP